MQNFIICKKLNYDSESLEKQKLVDKIIQHISSKMIQAGFSLANEKDKIINYVFSIGGDGTMLHAMRNHVSKNSIVVGINVGNVGFLTPYSIQDILDSDVISLISETSNPRIEKRSILSHKLENLSGFAVNDYAITADKPNDLLSFSVEIEHRGLLSKAGHYQANSLVISGPCGSTAYNMNAGGSIIDPVVKCMQMVMISPTTLGSRPLIISKKSIIHVHVHQPSHVYADGMFYHTLNPNEKFTISLMAKESNILVPSDFNFFSVLAKKLHWNNGKDVS